MAYVIACGDEGVQINQGTRLGVVGSGFKLEGFSEVVAIFKKLFGDQLYIVANEENDWIKEKMELATWEQTTATAQQQIQALADKENLTYGGFLPFTDPKQLVDGIKGHMVRPHKVHIANNISFTLGGGEQKFHLGRYVISADWVSEADPKFVKTFVQTQVDFYQKLAGDLKLGFTLEETGELGADVAAKNKAVLASLGFLS